MVGKPWYTCGPCRAAGPVAIMRIRYESRARETKKCTIVPTYVSWGGHIIRIYIFIYC